MDANAIQTAREERTQWLTIVCAKLKPNLHGCHQGKQQMLLAVHAPELPGILANERGTLRLPLTLQTSNMMLSLALHFDTLGSRLIIGPICCSVC